MSPLHSFPLVLVLTAASVAAGASEPLFDIASRNILQRCQLNDCRAEVASHGGRPALKVHFGHRSPYPNIRFERDAVGFSGDWSSAGALAVSVTNLGSRPLRVNVRIDSTADRKRGQQGGAEIGAGERARLIMPIAAAKPIIGMRGQPPTVTTREPGDRLLAHNRVKFDPAHITNFQVFLARPQRDNVLLIHRIDLLPGKSPSTGAFVDRFGQYADADWPGKLHDESEFADRTREEEQDLAAHSSWPDRDAYGGWAAGPKLEAGGHFRVVKRDGKWWFVDPEGRLFWSCGVTCVRLNAATIIKGRERCFQWLPEPGDPLAQFYRGAQRKMYDFYAANLFRKYGADYEERFFDTTIRRLKSWGFTTIGNWSSEESWKRRQLPYTIPAWVGGAPSFVATSHVKAGLEKKKWFPDPFDPKFRRQLDAGLQRLAPYRDDPWLLGVFIHNELPWVLGAPWRSGKGIGIGEMALRNDSSMTIKRALAERLKKRHATLQALNRAWGTKFASWDEPWLLTAEQRDRARSDLQDLDRAVAEQYFRVCREAMNANLPGVLYLGCRFSGMYARHIVDVARKYCDVVCFNIYEDLPTGRTVDELATELDFPVIIGEYHFGALDRGMFDGGLRPTRNQSERAARFAAYLRTAAQAPWCVGAHWFQYLDQALTGRADGENYNIGFVDATDDPYPEMRAAARRVNGELYRLRAGLQR